MTQAGSARPLYRSLYFQVITAIVIFISFLLQNFLFALFGSLLVALVIYMVSIIFKALSDSVKMGIQIAEKMARPN